MEVGKKPEFIPDVEQRREEEQHRVDATRSDASANQDDAAENASASQARRGNDEKLTAVEEINSQLNSEQEIALGITNKINYLTAQNLTIPWQLTKALEAANKSIAEFKTLLDLRSAANESNQTEEEKAILQTSILRAETMAEYHHLIAATHLSSSDIELNNDPRITSFNNANTALSIVARVAQENQPRKELITCYLNEAECFKNAVDALNNAGDRYNKNREAEYSSQGAAWHLIALEAEKDQPQQHVIDYYLKAVECSEKALAALDQDDIYVSIRARECSFQSKAWIWAGRKAQEGKPPQQINCLLGLAKHFEGIVTALDNAKNPDRPNRKQYLDWLDTILVAAYKDAKTEKPRQDLITHCLNAAEHFQKVVAAVDNTDISSKLNRPGYVDPAAAEYVKACYYEHTALNPRTDIIDYRLKAVENYKQGEAALENTRDPDRVKRSEYYENIAAGFSIAALNAEGGAENNLTAWSVKNAEFYQKALAALDDNKNPYRLARAEGYSNIGQVYHALFAAAKGGKSPQQITFLLESAKRFEGIVTAFDNAENPDRSNRRKYLKDLYAVLSLGFEEAKTEAPRQDVITHCLNAAEYFKGRVAALDRTDALGRRLNQPDYFDNLGGVYCRLCGEVASLNPRARVIDYYLKSVENYKQSEAALENTDDPDSVKRSEYYENIGSGFYLAASGAGDEASEDLITLALKRAEFSQKALAALDNNEDPDRLVMAKEWNNMGRVYCSLYFEDKEKNPCQEAIRSYLEAAEHFQNAVDALNDKENTDRVTLANNHNEAGKVSWNAALAAKERADSGTTH